MDPTSSEPTKPLSELDPYFENFPWSWCGENEPSKLSAGTSAKTTDKSYTSGEHETPESDSNAYTLSKFDSFPKPGTIPASWDLSEM